MKIRAYGRCSFDYYGSSGGDFLQRIGRKLIWILILQNAGYGVPYCAIGFTI